MALQDYDWPLGKLPPFKYMGHFPKTTDHDWTSVIANLQKARKIWSRLDQILGREGAYTSTSGHLYVATVHVVLLFELETWVVTPHIKHLLGGFHHRVARRISGNFSQRWADGMWDHPPLGGAMREAGIKDTET